MNIAEKVLDALEVFTPGRVMLGEERFDSVTEALYANAKCVPGPGLFRAQRFSVKIPGAFESFERQTFGGKAADGDEARTLAKCARQAAPGSLDSNADCR